MQWLYTSQRGSEVIAPKVTWKVLQGTHIWNFKFLRGFGAAYEGFYQFNQNQVECDLIIESLQQNSTGKFYTLNTPLLSDRTPCNDQHVWHRKKKNSWTTYGKCTMNFIQPSSSHPNKFNPKSSLPSNNSVSEK